MIDIGVHEIRAMTQQAIEPAGIFIAKTREIVVPKLVHRDQEDQPHIGACRVLGQQGRYAASQHRKNAAQNKRRQPVFS
jgi:hypothetical protein